MMYLGRNPVGISYGAADSAWELITEYTVPANAASVEVTTDTNGDGFTLAAMYTRVSAPAPLTSTQDYIKGETYIKKTDGTVTYTTLPTVRYTSSSATGFFEYTHELITDIMVMTARSSSSPNVTQNLQGGSTDDLTHVKAIKGIKLERNNASSTMIPAGTVIKIYGIRKHA